MRLGPKVFFLMTLPALLTGIAFGQEKIDYEMINRIREESFERSRVMEIAGDMCDVYGPRFSHSPAYKKAAQWARQKFEAFGLESRLEPYGEVGVGWECLYVSVHMHAPQYMPMIAYAKPYSRGTNGKIISDIVPIDTKKIFSEPDLERFKGKLRGKIIFVVPKRLLTLNFRPDAVRLSKEELDDMEELRIRPMEKAAAESERNDQNPERDKIRQPLPPSEIEEFFEKEGVAAFVEPGGPQGDAPMDKGKVVVSAGPPLQRGAVRPLPAVIVAVEHYNRVMRLLEKGLEVKMEIETRVNYDDQDLQDSNVMAELPGTDLKDEIVMIGGHYDSEPAGTGATDNAAGSAIVMEAMRILKAVGARPRRTIRAALWGCEEAGHLGSKAYVKSHFADPSTKEHRPDYDKLSVYLNVDWYGRFRGIYLQRNDLVRPIFEEWMRPFQDVGMTTLVPGNTGGTDHMSFVEAGLPGFQFVQDDLEFFTTTFHTNMDVYDRLVPEDLMQASVVLAAFAYDASMRDDKLPRTSNQMKNDRRWHK